MALIEKICKITGDKLTEKSYNRLSSLHLESQLFSIKNNLLRPGDCIITFSVSAIHKLKKLVYVYFFN